MPIVSRMGDMSIGTCCCHSKPRCRTKTARVIVNSANQGSEAKGVGTLTSMVLLTCGHVSKVVVGSATNKTNAKSKARVTDVIVGCYTAGKMITGATKHNSG